MPMIVCKRRWTLNIRANIIEVPATITKHDTVFVTWALCLALGWAQSFSTPAYTTDMWTVKVVDSPCDHYGTLQVRKKERSVISSPWYYRILVFSVLLNYWSYLQDIVLLPIPRAANWRPIRQHSQKTSLATFSSKLWTLWKEIGERKCLFLLSSSPSSNLYRSLALTDPGEEKRGASHRRIYTGAPRGTWNALSPNGLMEKYSKSMMSFGSNYLWAERLWMGLLLLLILDSLFQVYTNLERAPG